MTLTVVTRTAVPQEQTWDIEALFESPQRWQAEVEGLPAVFAELQSFQGKLNTAPNLLAYLEAFYQAKVRLERAHNYASMSASVDGQDSEAAARLDLMAGLSAQFEAASSFADPELLALDEATLHSWLSESAFEDYAVALRRVLRRKPHTRSAEVEQLLGQVQAPFGTQRRIHPTLANMDLQFGSTADEPITQGNVQRLLGSENRNTRREAWEQYADAHLAVKHAQAGMYTTAVRQNIFLAQARRYPDVLSFCLAPSHVPREVVTTLLETYQQNTPIWHRYWQGRRRWLKLPELREYDLLSALASRREVSYAQAVDWICEGMAPLGEEYVRQMRRGLISERWVDYAANQGKRQGAYSSSGGRVKPYIFMTWQNTISSYSTLAHEIGHSMHSWLSSFQQPVSIPRYTLFHAEVASNFNQAMVRQHLLNQARAAGDRDFEVQIIEEALSNFHRYFFIMPTLAAFELEVFERIEAGRPVSAPDLIELNADLLMRGYGSGVKMDRERSGIMWAQFSTHLYSNFYAYQYATGISAAHQILQQFDQDPVQARERYLAFLRSGGSLDPIDALQAAGVDMRSPQPVQATFRTLEGYVQRLEELLG